MLLQNKKELMKYEWVLFDADNTLFDFTFSQKMALQETFHSFNLPYNNDIFPIFTKLNNKIWQAYDENKISHEEIKTERFKVLFDKIGIDNIDLNKFNIIFIDKLVEHSKMIDGTEDFIKSLYGKIKIAIITNGMKEVQRPRFEKCRIKSHFEHIFISGEMGVSKPSSDYFQIVHEKTGKIAKSKYLVVGDNILADVKGGKSYGFDTCWYNPHGFEDEMVENADFEIKIIEELVSRGILRG